MNKIILLFLFLSPSLVLSQSEEVNQQSSEMILVEGNDEIKSFYIDRYEVTVSEFREFVEATNYITVAEREGGYRQYNPTGESYKIVEGEDWRMRPTQEMFGISEDSLLNLMANYPITHMAPEDAKAYAVWAGKRLPTLKEWKYAARAGRDNETFKYAGSNNARKVAWYTNNAKDELKVVGLLEPNGLGIYDMSGNAGEIVSFDNNPDKFIQKGGFFIGEKDYLEIDDDGIYNNLSKKDSWIAFGFRCVKEVEN